MNAPAHREHSALSEAPDALRWQEGVRAVMPTLFGTAAWGMVVGVAMIKSGLTVLQACGMTLFVYAGSAQLAALPLMLAQAPIWLIFTTGLMMNLRFVIFSALMGPHFPALAWRQKLFYGYLCGDMNVAMFLQRYVMPNPEPGKLSYLKALLFPSWLAWQGGTLIGIFVGNLVPTAWGLGFAATLAILCILVPLVINSAALCGVLVAATVAVLAHGLPYKLGLLAAVVLGMLAAMAVESFVQKREVARG